MLIPNRIFGTAQTTQTCIGAFSVHWENKDGELKKSSFSRKKYTRFPPRRFRYLKKQRPFMYQVDGNCCWVLYEREYHKGGSVMLESGNHLSDVIQRIRSLEKVFCE